MEEGRTEPLGADRRDRRRLTVAEAATVLGVTVDAVRGRIRRGKLAAEHEEGTVYVFLEAEGTDRHRPSEASQGPSADESPLVEVLGDQVDHLQDQVAYLRDQLDKEREANRENRRLLAAALERIPPQLEPPRDASQPAADAPEGSRSPARPPKAPRRPQSPAPSGAGGAGGSGSSDGRHGGACCAPMVLHTSRAEIGRRRTARKAEVPKDPGRAGRSRRVSRSFVRARWVHGRGLPGRWNGA
jgi:hypothetical protein